MIELPEDCLRLIISGLGPFQRLAVRRVNRQWNKVVTDVRYWYNLTRIVENKNDIEKQVHRDRQNLAGSISGVFRIDGPTGYCFREESMNTEIINHLGWKAFLCAILRYSGGDVSIGHSANSCRNGAATVIGAHSFAIGPGCCAVGCYSIAMGLCRTAIGAGCLSIDPEYWRREYHPESPLYYNVQTIDELFRWVQTKARENPDLLEREFYKDRVRLTKHIMFNY